MLRSETVVSLELSNVPNFSLPELKKLASELGVSVSHKSKVVYNYISFQALCSMYLIYTIPVEIRILGNH